MSLEELKKFVKLEYQALCRVTGLAAVPLDIWLCVDGCLEKTVEGNYFAQSTLNRTRFSWTRTWVNDPKGGGQERWGRRKGPSEARAGVMVRG